jgi:hypothetical protein
MEYKIVSASSPQGLSNTINVLMGEGWEPIGSHQVVVTHDQNRYRGTQHIDTTHETEYSQTMIKKINKNVIEVDIMFNHPEDENGIVDETIKVYDIEGMREEFEYELNHIINND